MYQLPTGIYASSEGLSRVKRALHSYVYVIIIIIIIIMPIIPF
jgi:hypothetical protein